MIADGGIDLQQKGLTLLASMNTDVGTSLVAAIDDALAVAPDNADLLVAKSAALTLSFGAENTQEVLQRALSIDPNHFDGRMLRDHADSWNHLFFFPSWSESYTELHPVMAEWTGMQQSLQIVRDGLGLGLAVVNATKSDGFPSSIRRSAWKLIWSKTPYGHIAFHYAMLDCGPGDIRKQEAGLPHVADVSPTVRGSYWILRRLRHLKSCFVVFSDGRKVLLNTRFVFPETLRTSLSAMDHDLESSGPVHGASACQPAAQWYMQNVDFESVGFDEHSERAQASETDHNKPCSLAQQREAVQDSVTDIDGNVYKTVKIGSQIWMAENLKVTHYRNGEDIPNVAEGAAWLDLSKGAYCNYSDNVANVATYGRLYNWYAVVDCRSIAPIGWHVPTDIEWQMLIDYLGGEAVAGGKMKEAGTTRWWGAIIPDTGATNESGFTALPGGCRGNEGYFKNLGDSAAFWASTESNRCCAWNRFLSSDHPRVNRYHGYYKEAGFSVRCVKD
jgi:uncharacterized protein (TIGR02145 family)